VTPYTVAEAEADLLAATAAEDWQAANLAGAWLDRHDPARSATVYGSALWYAQQGLHVFPITALSKKPCPGTRGLHDASTDPDQVHAWWARWPDANVAIATGHLVDVIDLDGLKGHLSWGQTFGPDDPDVYACACGYQWDARLLWSGMCSRCGGKGRPWVTGQANPATAPASMRQPGKWGGAQALGTVSTPRPGGLHVYVRASGHGNRAGMLPGVDYRGLGGYVLAPPSQLDDRDDQHPGTYAWLRPLDLKEHSSDHHSASTSA
jgi:hypothetical protein